MPNLQLDLRNLWCLLCKHWLSSTDIDQAHRHRDCGTRCEWRVFCVECFEVKPLRAQDART